MSGDSHLVLQQSRSGIQYCDEGEGEGEGDGEQVLQPKIKRKRSIRVRSRHTMEGTKGKYSFEKPSLHGGNVSQLPSQVDYKYEPHFRNHPGLKVLGEPKAIKPDHYDSSLKSRQSMPLTRITSTSKAHASLRSIRLNSASAPSEDAAQHSRESWDGKVMNTSGTSIGGSTMSDVIQKRVCIAGHATLLLCSSSGFGSGKPICVWYASCLTFVRAYFLDSLCQSVYLFANHCTPSRWILIYIVGQFFNSFSCGDNCQLNMVSDCWF